MGSLLRHKQAPTAVMTKGVWFRPDDELLFLFHLVRNRGLGGTRRAVAHSPHLLERLNLLRAGAFYSPDMPPLAEPETLPVAAARAGDPAAWGVLFQRYQLPLYAYIFEFVRHEQTGLDLVQETFIRAVRHVGGLRDDAKFGGWLFGIAHQQCVQHWRKAGREKIFTGDYPDQPDDETPDPGELLIREEQTEQFRRLLAQLPLPQRAVLTLYFLEDFSIDEIARITGAPAGTVKSRMHHAKRTLKKLLEEQS